MPDSAEIAAETFYVTTPIYYVNARPHIGHSYTTIVADVLARRHRLLGQPTFFLTGTDEHGQKIERSAIAAGIPPQQFADAVSASFRALWSRMGITNDAFIRTTDPHHKRGVQHLFRTLQQNGFIYKGTYTGQYCVSDEAYVDGPPGILCPDCGRLTETVSESNYYFRLSAFQLPLLNLIESDTLRIRPDSARNEVLSFLRGNTLAATQTPQQQTPSSRPEAREASRSGETPVFAPAQTQENTPALPRTAAGIPYVPGTLKDLSISRTSFSWGVPVPGDEEHVIYVWLDALANYMTALGYGSPDTTLFDRFWPANLHLVGKEITRFHCIYWPAFLLALDPNSATVAPDSATVEPNSAVSTPTTPRTPSSRPEDREAIRSGETPVFAPATSTVPATVSSRPESQRSEDAAERPAVDPATEFSPEAIEEANKLWAKKWLPKEIVANGWLLFDNSKMSKSKGNVVRTETILTGFGQTYLQGIRDHNTRELKKDPTFQPVPDPTPADQDLFASDVLRYFLLREIPFGQDGSFSFDAMVTRYNADLANGYGNLVSRTLAMIGRYSFGIVPSENRTEWTEQNWLQYAFGKSPGTVQWSAPDDTVDPAGFREYGMFQTIEHALRSRKLSAGEYGDIGFQAQLAEVALLIRMTDGFISFEAPWNLAKEIEQAEWLSDVLYTAAEAIRILTALLYPILPFSTARVWAQLGLGSIEDAAARGDLRNLEWGGLKPGTKLGPLAPIFPRADTSPDKGLARIMADLESTPPPSLLHVANDEHDAATTDQTAFREAPLASVAAGTSNHAAAAEAATEQPSQSTTAVHATQTPSSRPSEASGETPVFAPAHTQGGTPVPAEPIGTFPSTDPAAPPRTSSLPNGNPGTQVGGSYATTTATPAPTTPTHVAAEPSGIFATTASTTPISATPADASPQITIDDFAKVELRVAEILVAERIPKADKLLRLEVDLGHERRQILSGIAEWYTPESLVGRRIVVITNLAPRKMRGLDSHGMLLAASGPLDPANPASGKPALATFADTDTIPLGSRLK